MLSGKLGICCSKGKVAFLLILLHPLTSSLKQADMYTLLNMLFDLVQTWASLDLTTNSLSISTFSRKCNTIVLILELRIYGLWYQVEFHASTISSRSLSYQGKMSIFYSDSFQAFPSSSLFIDILSYYW